MSSDGAVAQHYTAEALVPRVEAALRAAGLDSPPVRWEALAPLDEFHVGGLQATRQLADALAPEPGSRVLDLGSGLGGPARLLAAECVCAVTGIDLSHEFVDVAVLLSRRAGLGKRTRFVQGDVTELPFPDASFDHAWSQHVAMNIHDRRAFYAEARRVIAPGGRLAIYDVVARGEEPLIFPVPWAASAEASHLLTADETRATLESAGFTTLLAEDLTGTAIGWLAAQRRVAQPSPRAHGGLGLHVVMGSRFAEMAENLAANLTAARVGVDSSARAGGRSARVTVFVLVPVTLPAAAAGVVGGWLDGFVMLGR